MADIEPGDRPTGQPGRPARQLERPPGERYGQANAAGRAGAEPAGDGSAGPRARALFAPVTKAVVAAALGMLVLYALGALLSSSVGLVFVAGLIGAVVGLLLARAARPGPDEDPGLTRRQVMWAAVGLTLLAIVIAAVGTWLHALAEGGALGILDYLLETFGIIVPAELVIGAVAAAWGAGAGPIEG